MSANIKKTTEMIMREQKELASRGSRYGYERTADLLRLLGNPEEAFRIVHIAGTNGKGSTSKMIAQILIESGYRVGQFSSPFLTGPYEYFCVNNEYADNNDYARTFDEVHEISKQMPDPPTEFEISFAAAMLWFKRTKCDFSVVECGLGGLSDATNAIKHSECCVITNIGLDHTGLLGNTLKEIATQKAGIIKRGIPVVVYPENDELMDVFKEAVLKANAPFSDSNSNNKDSSVTTGKLLVSPDFNKLNVISDTLDSPGIFTYRDKEPYLLRLKGKYQFRNAAAALETALVLADAGANITSYSMHKALEKVFWPARFEIAAQNVLLDGGHNPQCISALCESLSEYGISNAVFVIGVMADKDYREMFGKLKPYASTVIATEPHNARRLDAAGVINAFSPSPDDQKVYFTEPEPSLAVKKALQIRKPGQWIVVTGSLYMMGEIRKAFENTK